MCLDCLQVRFERGTVATPELLQDVELPSSVSVLGQPIDLSSLKVRQTLNSPCKLPCIPSALAVKSTGSVHAVQFECASTAFTITLSQQLSLEICQLDLQSTASTSPVKGEL